MVKLINALYHVNNSFDCHCSTPVIIHCRVLLCRVLPLRTLENHTSIQNKHLKMSVVYCGAPIPMHATLYP